MFVVKFDAETQDKLATAIIHFEVKGGEGSFYAHEFIIAVCGFK